MTIINTTHTPHDAAHAQPVVPQFIIRRLIPSDSEGLSQLYTGPQAYSQTLHLPDSVPHQWDKTIKEMTDNEHAYVALINEDLVGHLSLTVNPNPRRRHVGRLTFAVRDDFHGKGIGSALMAFALNLADKWLNLQRLEVSVLSDNPRAIGLLTKYGFAIEGESQAFAYRNGRYADAYHLARIKANVAHQPHGNP